MNRKLKLALAALLGFSTACSTVKKNAQGDSSEFPADSVKQVPQLVVMYGTRPPRRPVQVQRPEAPAPQEVPAAEPEVKPSEE